MTVRSSTNASRAPEPGRPAAGSANKAARRAPVSAEECERIIAIEAYFRAERRGFEPGHELEDWCAAEAEVLRRLGTHH